MNNSNLKGLYTQGSNTPSVNPDPDGSITQWGDPSIILVTGSQNTVADELNKMYVLGLRHALQAIEQSPLTAVEFIKNLINKSS